MRTVLTGQLVILPTKLRQRVQTSLGVRMALVMGAIATATAAILAVLSFVVSQHLIADKQRNAFALQAESVGRQISFEVDALRRTLLAMAGNAFVSNALVDSYGREQYLFPFLRDQSFPGHWSGELWLVDFEGKPIAGNARKYRFDHQGSEAVHLAMTSGQERVELAHDNDLLLAAPIVFPPTGSVEGAMVAIVDLRQAVAAAAGLVPANSCFELQVGRRELPIPEGCRATSNTPVLIRKLDLPESFQPLAAELRLYVSDAADSAAARGLALGYFLVVGAIVLLALVASRRMARRIVHPLVQLTETADSIVRQERLDLRAPDAGRDETGRLANAFNTMVASLQATHRRLAEDIARRERLEQALTASEEKYRLLIENQTDLVLKIGRDGRLLFVSPSCCRAFGKSEEQLLGERTLLPLAEGHTDKEHAGGVLGNLLRPPYRDYYEQRALTRDGWRWFGWACTGVRDDGGEVTAFIAVGRDTTDQKVAEEALFESRERAQVTLHSIGDAVITTDRHSLVDYLNPVAQALTGWTLAEAQGQPLHRLFRITNEQTRQPAPDPVQRCLREGKIVGVADHTVLLGRQGREYYIDHSAAPIRARDGDVLGAVLVFHDVTETRRLTRQLEHDATHDALTGLINRSEFERRLERAVATSRSYGASHALCFLDLDQFKLVNDTAGHAAGDELLRQIRGLMSSMFRERDTLARIGGDEFGLLLNNCPLDRAQQIAQSVVSAVRDFLFHWEDRSYQIGVSIGLVGVDSETQDAAQLMMHADVACYMAKELGRNQVHVYQRADREAALRHSEILGAAGLREALEESRFRVHFQPIVALAGSEPGRPTSYEALLRIADTGDASDDGELVLPAAFIPAAERFGLMGSIDRWVIQQAFSHFARGIGQTGARISINLSGNSLIDATLFDYIDAQLAASSIPPDRVCFEIAETSAIQNLRRAIELMRLLKERGCQLALDDFGSGLSSFHYLKSLPVDYLKIDGSFVRDMGESARDCALVAAINQMSHAMGIKTVAEYAHSARVVGLLRDLGVDYAQGCYIGQPAPWGGELGTVV